MRTTAMKKNETQSPQRQRGANFFGEVINRPNDKELSTKKRGEHTNRCMIIIAS